MKLKEKVHNLRQEIVQIYLRSYTLVFRVIVCFIGVLNLCKLNTQILNDRCILEILLYENIVTVD